MINLLGREGLGVLLILKITKIFAGYGDKFHFGIQTSANINTNPRTENGCITINKEIFPILQRLL